MPAMCLNREGVGNTERWESRQKEEKDDQEEEQDEEEGG